MVGAFGGGEEVIIVTALFSEDDFGPGSEYLTQIIGVCRHKAVAEKLYAEFVTALTDKSPLPYAMEMYATKLA